MSIAGLAQALAAAGFPGVEIEGDQVFARLSAADGEFSAWVEDGLWQLQILRPLRAPVAELDRWAADHPGAVLDLHRGETRLRLSVTPGDGARLARWAALAEELLARSVRWRQAQRARGEGY